MEAVAAAASGTEEVCFASKGYLQFVVRVATRGAISGYPNAGGTSIRIAADVIRDLDALENIEVDIPSSLASVVADPDWRARHDELMGEGTAELLPLITVNIGMIGGGSSPSVVASDCAFSVSVVVPVSEPTRMWSSRRPEKLLSGIPRLRSKREGADAADFSDPDSEMAIVLQSTVESLGRVKPEMHPAIAISDCRYWRYRGTSAFWYGPEEGECSAADESVAIDDLLYTVRTHALTVARYLLET